MASPGSTLQGSRPARGFEFSRGGSSHLIRSAEKLAATGRYDFAIEQLNVAQQLDPENRYIQAIIDRIRVMQSSQREGSMNSATLLNDPGRTSLSITVGPQFLNGVKSAEDEQPLTPEDVHAKIRFLTNLANQYLEKGSSEQAFDSLMKAYLLDPVSPYVVAAEKTVLPAWENLRTLKKNDLMNTFERESTAMALSPFNNTTPQPLPRPIRPLPASADENQRMELLRQQKEQERVEKERVVWREASKPPKIFGEDDPAINSTPPQPEPEKPKHQSTGLFSRLRLGKFLE